MTLTTARSTELDEALGPGSPIVVFDRVSLAFDDKVILSEVSFTLITGHTTSRAPPGSFSGGRSTMAEYSRRLVGIIVFGRLHVILRATL